jgi:hypothetical protein
VLLSHFAQIGYEVAPASYSGIHGAKYKVDCDFELVFRSGTILEWIGRAGKRFKGWFGVVGQYGKTIPQGLKPTVYR